MMVMRRVSGEGSLEATVELGALGVGVPSSGSFGVWVDEADPRWPQIQAWMAATPGAGSVSSATRFTEAELDGARFLRVRSNSHVGYPQPENDFGFLEVTYDLSGYCEACGTGMVQDAPFRMSGEPRWGRRGFFAMNWVFDEHFVLPEVWASVFKPRGIASREVLNKKGARLTTVVQLVVDERVDVDASGLSSTICPVCNREKFGPGYVGFSPRPIEIPNAPLARSNQWFGSGGSGFNLTIANQELRQAMVSANIKGVLFDACTLG